MENIKSFKHVYFLYSFEKNKKIKLVSELPIKTILTSDKVDDKKILFQINLYSIYMDMTKLIKNEKRIKIQLINNDNQTNYECLIDIPDKSKNIYLYDIEFKKFSNFISLFSPNPPPQYNLSIDDKYEIFRKINKIKIDDEDKDEKENNNERKLLDLIHYTHIKLENERKYNFSIFGSIFNDISQKNDIIKHLEIFDLDKIIFDDKKISFNLGFQKILLFYKDLFKKNDVYKIYHDIFCFLLLLNKYSKDSFEIIFFSKKMNIFIYNILLEDKRKPDKEKLFSDLKLSKNVILESIKALNNYKDIQTMISYNDNFLESLEIINKNFLFIIEILKKESEDVKKIIFDDFVKPNINDDLIAIKNQLEALLNLEKHFQIFLIEISSELLEKYFIFHKNNINELH